MSEALKITVLAERLPEAERVLNKLVKKAQRYGCEDVSYTVGVPFTVEENYVRWDGSQGERKITWVDVTVAGDAPRVGDFEFLASIEVGPGGNFVDTKPGVEDLHESFRHSTGHCDHCKKERSRKHVFAVRNLETGDQLQIGRTCLRDFLGMDDPKGIIQRFTFWKEVRGLMEEGPWQGASYAWCESLVSILAATATCIRLFGWASKGQAMDSEGLTSTADYVELALGKRPRPVAGRYDMMDDSAGELWDKIRDAYTDEDAEVANKTLAWVRAMNPKSDYEHNLTVACAEDTLNSGKRLGLVVSAVSGWLRAQEREVRRTQERVQAQKSTFQGEVKERLRDIPVTITQQRYLGSDQWGDKVLVKFRDDAGNLFTWFTSSATGLQDGEKAIITGTVKKHNEFNDIQETVLNRVKVEART